MSDGPRKLEPGVVRYCLSCDAPQPVGIEPGSICDVVCLVCGSDRIEEEEGMSNKNGPDSGDPRALIVQADALLEQAYYASKDADECLGIAAARGSLAKVVGQK